jgi:hypothetical protein
MVIDIFVRIEVVSLNRYLQWHWRKRHTWRKQVHRQVSLALMVGQVLVERATTPKRVRLTRYCARKYDFENYTGGCKPVLDSLKECGLIVDDSPAWVQTEYVQQVSPTTKRGLQVEVWDAEEAGS